MPAPIGSVEIDGVGRFDIHPTPEDMAEWGIPGLLSEGEIVAFWHGGMSEGKGGRIVIFVLPATGDPTRSSVWVEFFLSDDRTELERIQSRGIRLNGRLAGGKYEWVQFLDNDKVTLEELSVEGNGPMTLKLRFDGTATRHYSSGSPPPGEVPMKGVLEVTGLPYRPR